jgi:hypothetical protein
MTNNQMTEILTLQKNAIDRAALNTAESKYRNTWYLIGSKFKSNIIKKIQGIPRKL